MAILATIDYAPVPVSDYDAMMPGLEPSLRQAPGFISHAALVIAGRLTVQEVWQSRDDFERWMRETIVPALENTGGAAPAYEIQEIHYLSR